MDTLHSSRVPTDLSESLEDHFSLPRISALYDDLNPGASGEVSWKQTTDCVAVTWWNVPEFNSAELNSFQIEMFADGKIRVTWLSIAALDGLAGVSEGNGLPRDFVESDLTHYPLYHPRSFAGIAREFPD